MVTVRISRSTNFIDSIDIGVCLFWIVFNITYGMELLYHLIAVVFTLIIGYIFYSHKRYVLSLETGNICESYFWKKKEITFLTITKLDYKVPNYAENGVLTQFYCQISDGTIEKFQTSLEAAPIPIIEWVQQTYPKAEIAERYMNLKTKKRFEQITA